MNVGPWIGVGDKIAADQAAVDGIHRVLSQQGAFRGTIIIGEGEKDEAPMLAHGTVYGTNSHAPAKDIAVDPLDGTTLTSQGLEGGISALATADPGTMPEYDPDTPYGEKFVVGRDLAELTAKGQIGLNQTATTNYVRAARHLGIKPHELRVAMLARKRNNWLQQAAEDLGIKPILLKAGDIMPGLIACKFYEGKDYDHDENDSIDMLVGSGGTPEGILLAAGVAALGGEIQMMWDSHNLPGHERVRAGRRVGEILHMADLVGTGETHLVLTAVTAYKHHMKGCEQDNESGSWRPGDTLHFSRPAAQ